MTRRYVDHEACMRTVTVEATVLVLLTSIKNLLVVDSRFAKAGRFILFPVSWPARPLTRKFQLLRARDKNYHTPLQNRIVSLLYRVLNKALYTKIIFKLVCHYSTSLRTPIMVQVCLYTLAKSCQSGCVCQKQMIWKTLLIREVVSHSSFPSHHDSKATTSSIFSY